MTEQPTPPHMPDLAELSAYLDRELAPERRQRIAAHLADCPACAASLARLQALAADFRALPAENLGFDLAGVIEGRLAAAPRLAATDARRDRRWRWPLAVGAAASVAIGVAMGSALIAGGATTASRMAAMRVFDPMPPGNLCIGINSCYVKESLK